MKCFECEKSMDEGKRKDACGCVYWVAKDSGKTIVKFLCRLHLTREVERLKEKGNLSSFVSLFNALAESEAGDEEVKL